jgi:crotonobetainyl-CoA:carnitine CoA-transferase CaiB-like acyl-CoA transferase
MTDMTIDPETSRDLLAGVMVLDLTLAAVGPFCTRVLADLGAEVIHVEWPRTLHRRWGGTPVGDEDTRYSSALISEPGEKGSQLFLHTNGGKKSLALNLKHPAGIALVKDLIAQADVLVENMTPRVMQSFGLDYATVSAINPRLIMCSMSGYGQRGLDGDTARACTDPIAQAMSGISWITGNRDGAPYAVGGGLGDSVTALTGVAAILAALYGRAQTGRGQFIDISMVESLAFLDCVVLPNFLMSDKEVTFRNGQQSSYTMPMGPFRGTGGFISMQAPGSGEASPWGRLCGLMGREDMIEDPRYLDDASRVAHTEEVIAAVEGWLCSFDDTEAPLLLLSTERISSGPVLSQRDMSEHSFFQERNSFSQVEYPECGPVTVMEPPFNFSDADAKVRGPAPEMGEHTRSILQSRLGLSDDDLAKMFESDVIAESAGARRRNGAVPTQPAN